MNRITPAITLAAALLGCSAPQYARLRPDAPPVEEARTACQYEVAMVMAGSNNPQNWVEQRRLGLMCMERKGWMAQP